MQDRRWILYSLSTPMSLYINERCTLNSDLNRINPEVSQASLQLLTNTPLFGNSSYSDKRNTYILNATINYIRLTESFDDRFFWTMRFFFFSFIFLTKLPICMVTSSSIIFFRLRLNFNLFYFTFNCKIIFPIYLAPPSVLSYLLEDDLWISRKETVFFGDCKLLSLFIYLFVYLNHHMKKNMNIICKSSYEKISSWI